MKSSTVMPENEMRLNQQGRELNSAQLPLSAVELLRVVRRRKRGIVLTILLSFGLVFAYHLLSTPEYKAVSMLMIKEEASDKELLSKVIGPDVDIDSKSAKKHVELLRSVIVSEMTVRELQRNLHSSRLELFGKRPYTAPLFSVFEPVRTLLAGQNAPQRFLNDDGLRKVALRLNDRITIQPLRETNLIKVSVSSPFADEAVLLTNTLCQVYRQADIGRNSEKYAQANRFISEMLAEQRRKLADADDALSNYMSAHEIYEMTGNSQQLLQKLVETDGRYNEIQAEYNITRNNLSFLEGKLSDAERAISSRISQNVNKQLGTIMDEVRMTESDYVKLVRNHGIDSPEAVAKKQQLELSKERYEQLSRSKIAGEIGYAGRSQKYSFDLVSEKLRIERRLNELDNSAREFGRLKSQYEAQLVSLPTKQQEYMKLQRDRDAVSKTYVFLKEKLDETRILIGSEVGSVSIVGTAFRPVKPDSPDMKKTAFFCVLFSGLFAALYTFGAEKLDSSVKDVSFFCQNRLGRVFMIPLLGGTSVSASRTGWMAARRDDSEGDGSRGRFAGMVPNFIDLPGTAFAESIRTLRAHLDHQGVGSGLRSLVVSGTSAGEGNSSVCANLAMAFAMTGRKTLLVDCEFVHALQHSIFDCNREPGLADALLSREMPLSAALIQETGVENLRLLSAGKEVDNQAELLGSITVSELIAELNRNFDLILFDAPPMYQSGTVSLLRHVQGLLMVSRLGFTAEELVREVASDPFFTSRILGVALIDSEVNTGKRFAPNDVQC